MKIISLPRGCGKTTAAIRLSRETGATIVGSKYINATLIMEKALDMGFSIPAPIPVHKLMSMHPLEKPNRIIIDEIDWVMETLLGCKIEAITFSCEEEDGGPNSQPK